MPWIVTELKCSANEVRKLQSKQDSLRHPDYRTHPLPLLQLPPASPVIWLNNVVNSRFRLAYCIGRVRRLQAFSLFVMEFALG
jgi:hypothetical protein